MNDVAVDPTEEYPLLAVSGMVEAQECDHKGHYRLVNGMYVAIRICTVCGKSWRLPIRGEYPDEMPDAIWEEIDEPKKWASPVLPDYEG